MLVHTFRCPSSDLLFFVDLLDNSTDERLLLKRPFSLDYLAPLFNPNTWIQISSGPRTGFVTPHTQHTVRHTPVITLFDSVAITNDLYGLCSDDGQAAELLRLVSSGVSSIVIQSFTDSLAVSIWNAIIKQDRGRKGVFQYREETRFKISDDEQKKLSFDNFFNDVHEIFKVAY